ncbi:MAG TPA: DUF2723 domain-containing protein [Candidatus Saccharimonadales bacterium]|nr:DUF2723 domain-containing protein [Candidatus Saccharimonadales bacterium]
MRRWAGPIVVGLIAFGAAWVALLPGVAFWDTGELQTVAPVMGTAHPTGYPTYVLLGWLVSVVLQPFGDEAWRMNVFAALSIAVAAGVMVDLGRALTRSLPLGILAGLGLAFTESIWSIGTHAEAHALHVAFLAILLRLLVAWEDGRRDRVLIAAAVVFGLALGNHSLTLLLVPPVGLFVLAVEPGIWRRPRLVAACLAAVTVTTVLVFLELPLRAGPFRASLVYGTPQTWDGFWYIVLAQQFQDAFHDPFIDLTATLAEYAGRGLTAYGPLVFLLPVAFLATALRRPRYALLSGTAFLITSVFAITYINADIGRYYLGPILIGWTWLAVLAAAAVDTLQSTADPIGTTQDAEAARHGAIPKTGGRRRPELATRTAIAIAVAALLLVPTALALPTRYQTVDRSRDRLAGQWLDRTLSALEPDAVVLSWWSYSTPLWYAQRVEGRRPDIWIVDDRTRLDEGLGDLTDVIDDNLPSRPVYVLRLDPSEIALLESRYVLERVDRGDPSGLSRVLGPREASR